MKKKKSSKQHEHIGCSVTMLKLKKLEFLIILVRFNL